MSTNEGYFPGKIERLHRADQRFIDRFRKFEDAIRQHEQSIFGGSLEDHLLSVKRKRISMTFEKTLVGAVLNYHDWVCTSKQILDRSAYISLLEVIVSYEDVFHYCKMRVEELGQKTWTQSTLCRGILRMLQFIEAEDELDEEMKGKITKMRDSTNALIAAAHRDQVKYTKDRPSVDELREKEEMLCFTDLAKVFQCQVSYYYNICKSVHSSISHLIAQTYDILFW